MPVMPARNMTLCLPLPGPGAYAIVALHDRDSNDKLSVWSDGVGFSRNPRLGLSKPRPDAFAMDFFAGITPVRIILNYRRGLSVRPLHWRSAGAQPVTAAQHRLDNLPNF
jgi:hypothetical protein